MDHIGKVGINQYRDSISVWRVIIPLDIDRSEYIKTCYLTGMIQLSNSNGEQVRAKVGKLALQLINFPLDSNTFGSEVVCLTAPYSGYLYVSDVYTVSNEFYDQKENQYRFIKSTDDGFAEVRIDGEGRILLTVDSELSDSGEVKINVTNKDRSGKLTINVNGDVNLVNDGNVLFKTSKQLLIDSPKILLNESDEPVVLGNRLKDLISKLLDYLSSESAGPYIIRGQANYKALKEDLEKILSEISFVK